MHKYCTYGTIIDEDGKIVRQKEFRNTKDDVREFPGGINENLNGVIESGCCFYPLYNALTELGVEMIAVHPNKVKAIVSSKNKTDKIDSEKLARPLRLGAVPEAFIPNFEIRQLRNLIRYSNRIPT